MSQQPDLFNSASQKLKLQKPLAFFDIESTGTDFVKDRIVEIAVLRINTNGEKISKTYRLNPEIPIPPEASQVHGIYDEDVATCPKFKEIAGELYDLLNPCDLAGFNSNKFDIPMLVEEFLRSGYNFSLDNRSMVDVLRIYTHFEKRNLESAYLYYCNKTLQNAHSAAADVEATYEILLAQLERYSELPGSVAELHNISNDERIIDSARRFVYQDDKPVFNFGKYKGRSVEDVLRHDPGYFNWMMDGEFALHTKQKLKEIREQIKRNSR
ncbi:MAG: 3'-5' exonuclease [Chitinophagales bacterium]|nr:3'-5' exonuclease [Chitinophagales bacterium]MDW8419788.1 3'-5' exonuclease [Chitinophagales bacterium]